MHTKLVLLMVVSASWSSLRIPFFILRFCSSFILKVRLPVGNSVYKVRMDVHGSCVNVGPWGMVVELEGLGLLLKEQKKMPCRSGSPTFRQPGP